MKAGRHTTWGALVVFLAAALPGSGVHVHRHAGGEHAHVHPDGLLDAEGPDHDHDDAPDRDHDVAGAHHHHDAPDPAGRPILTDDDDVAPAHAHVRPLFQRALPFAVAPATVFVAAPLGARPIPPAPPARPLDAARSRGPPSPVHG